MITRPLDLASKLRPEPRNLDPLFFVNGGLIVLFFLLFGSKFVLAPAVGVDFQLPAATGAVVQARAPTSFISVTDSGQIFAGDGVRTMAQLQSWLQEEAGRAKKRAEQPVLLVRASSGVQLALSTDIAGLATSAGFVHVMLAVAESNPVRAGGKP